MKISCSNIKKFLIFSRGKAFRLFRKKDPPAYKKNPYIFQETELPPKKNCFYFMIQNILILQEVTFQA